MAKIMTATKDSLDGQTIEIEIHSVAAGTDSNQTFCLEVPGPKLTYQGQKDAYGPPLIPCTLDFTIRIDQDYPQVENFILNQLIVDAPFSYYVKLKRNGSLKYKGWILTDQVTIADADYPYSFKIRCTDALGIADKFPYTIKSGGGLDGQAFADYIPFRLLTHVNLAMNVTGVRDLYEAGEEYIATSVRWFETNWNNITDDPLQMCQVSHGAFYKKDDEVSQTAEDDEVDRFRAASEVDNCAEVLTKICKLFNARMYQQDGFYHIVQIQEMDNALLNKFFYEKTTDIIGTLTQLSQETSGFAETESKDVGHLIRRPGGTYQFQDPVSYVHVKHSLASSANLTRQARFYDLTRENWGDRETKEGLTIDAALIDNTANGRIRVYIRINHNAIKNTAGGIVTNWPAHYIKFRLLLRVGDYWYKRAALKLNDAQEWEYSAGQWDNSGLGYCEIVSKPNQQAWTYGGFSSANWTTTIIDFTTEDPIPEPGALQFQFFDYETISNSKIDRYEEKYTTAQSIIPIALFSTYSLPDLTALTDEEVNRIIKVHIKQGSQRLSLTYVTGIPSADTEFTISGANIILNKPFSAITTEVLWHDHGAALEFPWNDDSYYRVNYDTEEFSISVESDDPERNTSDNDYYGYIGENDLDNKIFIEEEIKMGDLPRTESKHKLMWYDDINLVWESTEFWSNDGVGSDRLLQYKADDHASFKNQRKRFVTGSFTGFAGNIDFRYETRITYEDIVYMFLQGSIDYITNTVNGTWIEVGRNLAGVTGKASGLVRVGRRVRRELSNVNNEIPMLTNRDGLTQTSEEIGTGRHTSISIEPMYTKQLKAGDVIELIDPMKKFSQEVTVTSDTSASATSIEIDEHIDYVFPQGSIFTLKVAASGSLTGGFKQIFTGLTGLTITATEGALPSELFYTDDQINKKVTIYRNGVRQWYNSSASDFDEYSYVADTGVITFQFALTTADKIILIVE